MRAARAVLIAALSEMENVGCNAKDIEAELPVVRADAAMQSLLREESRKQLDAERTERKEVQLKLELGNRELITLYGQQATVTAELSRSRTQNANRTANTTKSETFMTERASDLPNVRRCSVDRGAA